MQGSGALVKCRDLNRHVQVQATLHEEVLSTFGDNDTIDYERVMKLPYLVRFYSFIHFYNATDFSRIVEDNECSAFS